jgi:hypothetical protein
MKSGTNPDQQLCSDKSLHPERGAILPEMSLSFYFLNILKLGILETFDACF